MNVLEKILIWLNGSMTTPVSYGWFHLLSCLLVIIVIVFLFIKYKNIDNKGVKKILFICSLICLILEVYKQINFSFNYNETSTWWKYQWFAFPFQFCSTPMYIALIASLIKNKKIENACFAFLATFGLVGGLSVMIYPNTVFIPTIGINIQTMVHHGMQVIMGMYLILTKRIEFNFSTLKKALYVFLVLVGIALLINILTYYLNIDGGLTLFFISPFHKSSLVILCDIYEAVPYPIFLLIYIMAFTIGSSIILLIFKLFNKKKEGI